MDSCSEEFVVGYFFLDLLVCFIYIFLRFDLLGRLEAGEVCGCKN